MIVECLTDNKNRTSTAVRVLFRKGQLATRARSRGTSRTSDRRARPPQRDPEVAAIEAGAQDFEADGEGGHRFYTERKFDAVSKALAARDGRSRRRLGWRAKNPVTVDAAARAEVEAFLTALDEDDDVQRIYVGLAD